ncbi:MAG: hypothetical protein UV47_C0028G0004 [Parcubacteria group bacterium GW2011_GWA2_42_80]|nr:MAG: hypothetical protein UV47_C0028G0004 [Parcubacteria group bacterium GW2011_GWA2_42_80]
MESKEFYHHYEPNLELSESDWSQGFGVELERQRPKGELEEASRNIDWWHFTAYAQSLSTLDKQKTQDLLKVGDKESAVTDFRKMADGNKQDKWWNLPIYAARLRELGWYEPEFSDSEWEQFTKEIQERRNKNKLWHLAFYISQLSSLDQVRASELMQDNDWASMPAALAETSVGKDDNSTILALEMGNNLYKINPEKGINFLKAENINATSF